MSSSNEPPVLLKRTYQNTPLDVVLADCVDVMIRNGCPLPDDTKDPVALLIVACKHFKNAEEKCSQLKLDIAALEKELDDIDDDKDEERAEMDHLKETVRKVRDLVIDA